MSRSKRDLSQISPGTNGILNFMFVLYTIACFTPFLLVLAISVSSEDALIQYGYRLWPKEFSGNAYRYIFSDMSDLGRNYGITIFSTVFGTALTVLITTLFAYPLSRADFKYRNIFSFIVFFTMIFHGGLVPKYMVYTQILHLKNTIWVYIAPHLMSAWYVIVMRTFMKSAIPDSIVEAAKIDGASELQTFSKIVLPLSRPGIATVALFTSISIWNDWGTPLLFITKVKLYNLQFAMYQALQNAEILRQNPDILSESGAADLIASMPAESARMAMCIAAIGPIIFFYPFFQKYFVRGLTVGAVKG